jgi:hypothetical protein
VMVKVVMSVPVPVSVNVLLRPPVPARPPIPALPGTPPEPPLATDPPWALLPPVLDAPPEPLESSSSLERPQPASWKPKPRINTQVAMSGVRIGELSPFGFSNTVPAGRLNGSRGGTFLPCPAADGAG